MSYWWPPTPDVFDPVPRPLKWSVVNGAPYPSDEDQEIFGIGHGMLPGQTDSYGLPIASMTLSLGGHGWNKPPSGTPFLHKDEQARLDYYRRLIDIRAPEDPLSGGLAADTVDPATGQIVVNYIDFSDEHEPKRKKVSYLPQHDSVKISIQQWNPDQKKWEGEGFDIQRDFTNALPDIIKVFTAATSAFIGYVTGMPALAAAWNQIGQLSSSAALGGPPPSIEGWAQGAIAYVGAVPDFGKTMGDLIQGPKLQKSVAGNNSAEWLSELTQFGKETTSYFDKIRSAAEKYAASFPHIDLGQASQGVVSDDLKKAADIAVKFTPLGTAPSFDLNSYSKAVKAYFTALTDDEIHSIRKGVDPYTKGTFDTAYATMKAEQTKRNLMDQVTQEFFPTLTIAKRTQAGTGAGIVAQGSLPSAITHTIDPKMADLILYVRQLEMRYGI